MPIADKKYFSKENISLNKFDASQALAEQAVYCLELVAELVQTGLSFQFKGGNSLLLVLTTPQRFSIDVDIATSEPRERIDACLEKAIVSQGVFSKWTKRAHKTKPWLPLSSYFCFYNSHFAKPDDSFIMLDAQLRRSPYATHFVPICCGNLYKTEIKAEIPFASSIIGDKLLTLGPRTLGIPVGKGKEAQRLKHVFDVSFLLSTQPSLQEIRESLFACLEHENDLQEKSITIPQLLADTIAFCESVRRYASIPEVNDAMDPALVENVTGLAPFADHLFLKKYNWNDLKKDMARAALAMAAVCTGKVTDDEFRCIININNNDPEYYWEKTEKWLPGV